MRTSIEMMRALLLLLVVAVPTAAVGSSLAVGATDFPMLTPEKCATLSNAPPSEPILERERCSICKVITDNARLWNWVQEWCEYYACKMSECGYFRANQCKVIRTVDANSVVEMSPCPPKYLCSYCLQIPHTQVFGCFDNTLY